MHDTAQAANVECLVDGNGVSSLQMAVAGAYTAACKSHELSLQQHDSIS